MGFISLWLERRLEQEKYCHGARKTLWRKKEIYIGCLWKKIPKEGEREGARIKNKGLNSVKPWFIRSQAERRGAEAGKCCLSSSSQPQQAASLSSVISHFLFVFSNCWPSASMCATTLLYLHFGPWVNNSKVRWQNLNPQGNRGAKTPGAFPK